MVMGVPLSMSPPLANPIAWVETYISVFRCRNTLATSREIPTQPAAIPRAAFREGAPL